MVREADERVLFRGHASWRSMLGTASRGVLLALLAAVAAGLASEIADGRVQVLWVVVAAAAVLAAALCVLQLARLRTTYSITDRRLTIERGLLGRELHQTRLERIQNVSARQSLLDRLLGVGTVDFDTAGEAQFDFSFRGVADPRGIVRTVDDALHELRAGGPARLDGDSPQGRDERWAEEAGERRAEDAGGEEAGGPQRADRADDGPGADPAGGRQRRYPAG